MDLDPDASVIQVSEIIFHGTKVKSIIQRDIVSVQIFSSKFKILDFRSLLKRPIVRFNFKTFPRAPQPKSPNDEFVGILKEKNANRDTVIQIEPDQLLTSQLPAQLSKNDHQIQFHNRVKLLNIQSRNLLEQIKAAKKSPEQEKAVVELENKLSNMFLRIEV